jgi:hypothetical protein
MHQRRGKHYNTIMSYVNFSFLGLVYYNYRMRYSAEKLDVTPALISDDFAEMTDYVRTAEGRRAIERGFSDIREGRVIDEKGSLSADLGRWAGERRKRLTSLYAPGRLRRKLR